jgi:hypothetical protein
MTLRQLQQTGFATGLTALTAELAAADFAAELQPYLQQQRAQVAERVERFQPIIVACSWLSARSTFPRPR